MHSGNLLQATPHYVKAATSGEGSKGVSRNTFATFMQPDVLEPLEFPLGGCGGGWSGGEGWLGGSRVEPEGLGGWLGKAVALPLPCPSSIILTPSFSLSNRIGVTDKRCASGRWQPGISFGAFAEATVKSYYTTM